MHTHLRSDTETRHTVKERLSHRVLIDGNALHLGSTVFLFSSGDQNIRIGEQLVQRQTRALSNPRLEGIRNGEIDLWKTVCWNLWNQG